MAYSRGKLGDAIKEMAPAGTGGNWYVDKAHFVNSNYPWVLRGGYFGGGADAGAFNFYTIVGSAHAEASARAVLLGVGALD